MGGAAAFEGVRYVARAESQRIGESTDAGLWTRFLRLPSGALRAIERMREKFECMRFAGQAARAGLPASRFLHAPS